MEEHKLRTIKSKAELFHKFKYFSDKVTITTGPSIL